MRPNEPPEALAQLEHGRRQEVVAEGIPPLGDEPLASRLRERVAWRRERELVDDEERQRLAADVDPLPEGACCEEHGIGLRPEPVEEALPRRVALDEQRVRQLPAHALDEPVEGAVRAREDERAPARE